MIYVMSDIHGCYDKYIKMIEKIQLKEEDTLYVLGDVLDRGPEGIRTLLDLSKRKNAVLLRGNHDHQAGILLSNLHMLDDKKCPSELVELYGIWLSDGGKSTAVDSKQTGWDGTLWYRRCVCGYIGGRKCTGPGTSDIHPKGGTFYR